MRLLTQFFVSLRPGDIVMTRFQGHFWPVQVCDPSVRSLCRIHAFCSTSHFWSCVVPEQLSDSLWLTCASVVG
jgi:hypothetical protein